MEPAARHQSLTPPRKVLLTLGVALLLLLGMVLALGRRNVVWGGVLCGLLVLTRASAQGVALVVGVWVLWSLGWRRCLAFLAIVAVVYGTLVAGALLYHLLWLGAPSAFWLYFLFDVPFLLVFYALFNQSGGSCLDLFIYLLV